MLLHRTIIVLLGALSLMLAVIVLRTETVRVHYRISHLDRRADELREELRDAELELQRLRSPAMIRMRAAELKRAVDGANAQPSPARPLPPGPKSRKP